MNRCRSLVRRIKFAGFDKTRLVLFAWGFVFQIIYIFIAWSKHSTLRFPLPIFVFSSAFIVFCGLIVPLVFGLSLAMLWDLCFP